MVHCFCLLLLCVSLSQLSDCVPSFTQSPNSGNTTYVAEGAGSVTLAWNYNDDGFALLHVDLLYIIPGPRTVIVARKAPRRNLIVYSSGGYTGRISFSDRATFQISNIVQSDSRTFQCRLSFSDSDPPEYQQNAEVVVVVPSSIQLSMPSPVEVKEGDPVMLSCVASGNPKPSYTGTKDSATLQQTSNFNCTTSANKDHAGTYTCTARVTAPTVNTNPASYTHFKPQVTALYPNQTALNDGSNASFTCEAEAYPISIVYLWFKDGSQITSDPNGDYFIQPSGSGSSLRVNQIKKNSAGRYSCSGRNSKGTGIQAFVYFKVNYAPENVTVTSTNPQGVKEGQSATLTCYADGYPLPSFSWKFNGNPVNGTQQKTLVLTNVRVDDAGNYTCVASNFRGSKEFTREVHVRYPPKITHFPQDSYTVNETNNVTMVCGWDGVPVPDIIWVKTSSDKEVGRGENFTIVNTSGSDDGTYSCNATNELGSDSKEVTLNVQTRPIIATSFPMATNIPGSTGEEVKLTCIVRAKPLAQLTWKRDLNGNGLNSQIDDKVKNILT